MDAKQRQIIKENHQRFKSIDLKKLIQYLQEYKMFNRYMWEDIHSISDVLEFLPTRGPKAFRNFIEILRKAGYSDEADVLEKPTLESADKFFYTMSSTPLGHCLIINNMKFDTTDLEYREGSDVDAKSLEDFFTKAEFEVDVVSNLTSQQMAQCIKDFSTTKDFTTVDSMILIIMSHGGHVNNREILYGKDGNYIFKDDIYNFFSNRNLGLQCKPKVFFFIACRGKEKDFGVPKSISKESLDSANLVFSSNSDVILADKTDMLIINSDMLIINSTPRYNVTVRDHEKGTYFCQVLISVLNEYYKSHDLETMIKIANQRLEGKVSETYRIVNSIHSENTAWKKSLMLCRRN